METEADRQFGLAIGLSAAILVLVLGQLIYSVNTVSLFLFWLLAAMAMSHRRLAMNPANLASPVFVSDGIKKKISVPRPKELSFSRQKHPRFFQPMFLAFFFLFSGWVALAGLEVKFWLAEAYFQAGSTRYASGEGKAQLIKAAQLNPHRYHYQIALAKLYLNNILAETAKPTEGKDLVLIGNNIPRSINWAEAAVKTAPHSVVAHETIGMIYRTIGPYAPGSEGLAIQAFQEASKLEPSNPVLAAELGRAYLANNMPDQAIESYQRALELKSDYYAAQFSLAQAYARQKKYNLALEVLEKLTGKYDLDEIYYEQGRIYFNQEKFALAIDKFKQVISLLPDHANALYGLGLALEKIDRAEEALNYYQGVLNLNPGNEEVAEKVEGLKGGE